MITNYTYEQRYTQMRVTFPASDDVGETTYKLVADDSVTAYESTPVVVDYDSIPQEVVLTITGLPLKAADYEVSIVATGVYTDTLVLGTKTMEDILMELNPDNIDLVAVIALVTNGLSQADRTIFLNLLRKFAGHRYRAILQMQKDGLLDNANNKAAEIDERDIDIA